MPTVLPLSMVLPRRRRVIVAWRNSARPLCPSAPGAIDAAFLHGYELRTQDPMVKFGRFPLGAYPKWQFSWGK